MQATPTPNMKCHQTEQSTRGRSAAGYTYPNGRLLLSCLGLVKFSGFQETKTSAEDTPLLKIVGPYSKRFYNMSAKPITRLCGAKVVNYFGLSKSLMRKLKVYS